jgi:hypothetical protein
LTTTTASGGASGTGLGSPGSGGSVTISW